MTMSKWCRCPSCGRSYRKLLPVVAVEAMRPESRKWPAIVCDRCCRRHLHAVAEMIEGSITSGLSNN